MSNLKQLKVIVADDEAHIRMMLKMALTSMNAEVVGEAQNGDEAIELFKNKKPHILLLDINMPLKTGEEVLAEIKTEFPEACVIMMTSVADGETVEKCIQSGATSYILKDTPITEMKQMIEDAWLKHKSSRENTDG